MKDESAIALILKAAKYDPNHQDAVKEIQKSNNSLFYESVRVVNCEIVTKTFVLISDLT